MGWLYTTRYGGESLKDFFQRQLGFDKGDGNYGRVLDCAVVKLRTAYLAYERGYADGRETRIVGIVCLIDPKGDHSFSIGYKDMDESEGPYMAECPRRILDRLTPCENDEHYAIAWRAKCYANLEQAASLKLTAGDVIKFGEPVKFRDGRSYTEMTIREIRGPRICLVGGYRISRDFLKDRMNHGGIEIIKSA